MACPSRSWNGKHGRQPGRDVATFAIGYIAANPYKSAAVLSEKRRLERMISSNNVESRLWHLLEKEKLADLSQFHRPGHFDEVPLYSRDSDVAFLTKDADLVLLRFSLKFLRAVVAYQEHRRGYVAAITLRKDVGEHLVPHLFFACEDVRPIQERLVLQCPVTSFGKRTKKLIERCDLGVPFDVFEESVNSGEENRVFISLALPTYLGFATLEHFCRPAVAVK